ncbi:hypothetical protein KCU87_g9890, partial [Aureobasidium melanogenum]
MTRIFGFYPHTNSAMEDELKDDLGHTQSVDQVDIAAVKVMVDSLEQANTPGDVVQPQTAAPTQQSCPSPLLAGLRTPGSNEQSISSTITSQTPLQETLATPAAVRPQDTAEISQSAQETPEPPCTPRPLAQPRRYGPGTGYQVRIPTNMTPSRIYRSSFGPDTSQMHNTADAQLRSGSRILPIGELITSHGNRTYTLWANEQHKPTNCVSTQVIITNVNSTTTFKSYSGVSSRSPLEVLDDFSSLLRTQGIALMSLNIVQESFVAVVSTDKGWEELREGILHAAR